MDVAVLSGLIKLEGLESAQSGLNKLSQSFKTTGKSLTLLSAPFMAIGGLALKAATDFESSFAGVRKTVDATEEEFTQLAAGFRDMAKEIPVNVNELNRIGEAAGQLGIETKSILSFTKTMAALGVATNMSSDEAATSLARLANITQLPQDQIDRLGSTIVELGNNMATTESEIVDFGLRIASAGDLAGISEAQILAIGAAMSSVGIQAEAGGTAVQKVLIDITSAVAAGGSELAGFAEVARMSAAEFATAWKEDAGGAFASFVEGLGKQGDDAFATLGKLGLNDARMVRAFMSVANAGDLLRNSLDLASGAWDENTALVIEAEKRYSTFASQITMLKNQLQDITIDIGNSLIPVIKDMIDMGEPWLRTVAAFVKENPEMVKGVMLLTAAIGGLGVALFALGTMAPAIVAGVGFLLTPVGAVALAVAALGLAWATNFAGIRDATDATLEYIKPKLESLVKILNPDQVKGAEYKDLLGIPFTGRLLPPVQRDWEPKAFDDYSKAIRTAFMNVQGMVVSAADSLSTWNNTLKESVQETTLFGAIVNDVKFALDLYNAAFKQSVKDMLEWRAEVDILTSTVSGAKDALMLMADMAMQNFNAKMQGAKEGALALQQALDDAMGRGSATIFNGVKQLTDGVKELTDAERAAIEESKKWHEWMLKLSSTVLGAKNSLQSMARDALDEYNAKLAAVGENTRALILAMGTGLPGMDLADPWLGLTKQIDEATEAVKRYYAGVAQIASTPANANEWSGLLKKFLAGDIDAAEAGLSFWNQQAGQMWRAGVDTELASKVMAELDRQRQAYIAGQNWTGGGFATPEGTPYRIPSVPLAPGQSWSDVTGASAGGVTVVFNGDVYGIDDFNSRVNEAVRDAKVRGGG